MDKDQEASTLNKELQVTRNAKTKENSLRSEKNTPVSYLIPNGQPWKHTHEKHHSDWTPYTIKCGCVSDCVCM